jgi:RND family efflux transporter MFP subunit
MRWPAPLVLAAALGPAAALAAEVDCLIRPGALVDLALPVPGILAEVGVERGDRVAAGQTLARLDARVEEAALAVALARAEERAAVEAARSRLAAADRRLERARALEGRDLMAAAEFEAAELDREQARLELGDREEARAADALEAERIRRLLAQRALVSPLDGVVVDRHRSVGEYVDRDPVVTVASLDPLHVEVIAGAEAFGRLAPGDPVAVTLTQGAEGPQVEARVSVVDPFVDAASATFRLRLVLPNPEGRLVAGLPCRAALPDG